MRKNIILLIVSIIPVVCDSQNDTINQIDENNLKQGYWIFYGKDKPNEGYADTAKVEECRYVDNKKEEQWIKYYPNSAVKAKGCLKNGRAQNYFMKYYENGKIMVAGNFNNDQYYCVSTRYYENGNIEEVKHFDSKGIEIDTSYSYYSSGILEKKTITDTSNHILTEIKYDKSGAYLETQMTVLENRASFSLLQIAPVVIADSSSHLIGNYHFKLTYDHTPVFREFLLTVYSDSTYHVYAYIFESCYNYIVQSSGNWSFQNNVLNLKNSRYIPEKLILTDKNLVSEPPMENDGKMRNYTLLKKY